MAESTSRPRGGTGGTPDTPVGRRGDSPDRSAGRTAARPHSPDKSVGRTAAPHHSPDRSAGRTDRDNASAGIGRDIIRRRHHLPHWQQGGSYYWVTIRSGRSELPPAAREIVLDTLRHDHGRRYDLIAAVAMPDHVHAILRPLCREPGQWHDLSQILKLIKGVSARRINQQLQTTGQVWFPESYDRIIRDQDEYDTFVAYLISNPVRRELASVPEAYEFTIWPGECPVSCAPDAIVGTPDTLVGHRGHSPDKSVGRTAARHHSPDRSVGRTTAPHHPPDRSVGRTTA